MRLLSSLSVSWLPPKSTFFVTSQNHTDSPGLEISRSLVASRGLVVEHTSDHLTQDKEDYPKGLI